MRSETVEVANLWIQSVVALAAVGAAIVALVVGAMDRKVAREVAAEDRRAALEQAKLMFDLEVLLRLSQNIERAGHSDKAISRDMGAEAAALLNIIGAERLPQTWADKRAFTEEQAREYAAKPDTPAYKRHAIEVHLEINRVTRRIAELVARAPDEGGGTSLRPPARPSRRRRP